MSEESKFVIAKANLLVDHSGYIVGTDDVYEFTDAENGFSLKNIINVEEGRMALVTPAIRLNFTNGLTASLLKEMWSEDEEHVYELAVLNTTTGEWRMDVIGDQSYDSDPEYIPCNSCTDPWRYATANDIKLALTRIDNWSDNEK